MVPFPPPFWPIDSSSSKGQHICHLGSLLPSSDSGPSLSSSSSVVLSLYATVDSIFSSLLDREKHGHSFLVVVTDTPVHLPAVCRQEVASVGQSIREASCWWGVWDVPLLFWLRRVSGCSLAEPRPSMVHALSPCSPGGGYGPPGPLGVPSEGGSGLPCAWPLEGAANRSG